MKLLRQMRSDLLKMRHTSFYIMHLCIPVIGAALFTAYYSYAPWSGAGKVEGFFESMAIAFPIIIGVLCSMAIEKEGEAGHFKEMLGSENSRALCLWSRLITLMALGLCSLMAAIILFFIGFDYILGQNPVSFSAYMMAGIIMFIGEIFLYIFHVWISLKFGGGASIGIGIFESLICALLATGLGDGIWQMVPCAWAVRMCAEVIMSGGSWTEAIKGASVICAVFSAIAAVVLTAWFNLFEGRGEK